MAEPAFDDTFLLSARETEVLEHLANGFTTKEVARRISLSPRTIEHHIEIMRYKLRARNRVQLIAKAVAHGDL